jgi:hypothetical protein
MPHLIPLDRQVRMRWRNGRGEAREIAAWPAGSTLETFEWRISVATVTEDGPFSRFPGVVRTIALLDGAGLCLEGGTKCIKLGRRFAVATCAGDEEMHCKLLGGEVQVLNVMVRDSAHARLTAIDTAACVVRPARFRAVIAAHGRVECRVHDDVFTLESGDALLLDGARESAAPVHARLLDSPCGAVAVAIDTRDAA